jgi:glycosyltransferase involved in cell wall biosynthesis
MGTPLVLFTTDRSGWCFENISHAVSLQLSEFYQFKTMPCSRVAKEECDVLVSLWWGRALLVKSNTRCKAMVTCLYDHLSWCVNEQAVANFRLVLKHTAMLAVCNELIEREVRKRIPAKELPPIVLLEDGVDTELFRAVPMPPKFACGWTGRSSHITPGGPQDHKGLTMTRQACARAGVWLRVLDASNGMAWPLKRMPVFYQDVSVQVVASAFEGTPNPLLEAMAMGRPAISTRVGLAPKLIEHGVNGLLIERDEDALVQALQFMATREPAELAKMGRRARSAAEKYSWKVKARAWKECLDLAQHGHEAVRAREQVAVQVPTSILPRTAEMPPEAASEPLAHPEEARLTLPTEPPCPPPPAHPSMPAPPPAPQVIGDLPDINFGRGPGKVEVSELCGRPMDAPACQALLEEVDPGTPGRPTILLCSVYRFTARTLPVLRPLMKHYRFVMVQGDDKPTPRGVLVWSHYPFVDGERAVRIKKAQQIPFVQTCRGQFTHLGGKRTVQAVSVLKQASAIVTLTRNLQRHLVGLHPHLAGATSVIPNGSPKVEDGGFVPELPFPRPVLLTLSNFKFPGKRAGVDALIGEFNRVKDFGGTFLIAAQKGVYALPEGKLGRSVYYLGFIANKIGLIRASDIFLYNSYLDGQPTALIEAMAWGKPVVVGHAHDSGAAEFVRDGETGLIREDAETLVQEAIRLSQEPEEAARLGAAAAREMREVLTWPAVAEQYHQLFERLLDKERA